MANQIELAELRNRDFVDSTSRYDKSKIYYYGDKRIPTFEIWKKQTIPESPTDRFYVIKKGQEFRPDLVANIAYGIPTYWWKIMLANNIMDVYDFKAGLNIRIPSAIHI